MAVSFEQVFSFLGVLVGLFSLYGIIEWRNSLRRDAIYKKLDALRDDTNEKIKSLEYDIERRFVLKDVHAVTVNQHEAQITDLKKEIDQIKVKTEMIPQIQSEVKSIHSDLKVVLSHITGNHRRD